MDTKNIRNFVIIAHIDHGKSTLADRMLEMTNTVEKRKMKDQILDSMELEREKGITIKMQPVRMLYQNYILNLIDTPGHIDFNYEVSRALKAVEGAVLLVDATQGVQAQTITNVEMAKELGLVIIPVLNKIDLAIARKEETKKEITELLNCKEEEILEVSGKTGQGVGELLNAIVKLVPPPSFEFEEKPRALVFDFEYSVHQGVIVYLRMTDGVIEKGDELILSQAGEKFTAAEIGIFSPERTPVGSISAGAIGYVVTNIKKTNVGIVGDSVVAQKDPLSPLSGYMQPKPVVWASVYPQSQEDFENLRRALSLLRLSDSSLSFEEESSGALGRGFRCGFLGMLHLEIIIERLKREFELKLVIATPTITYKIQFIDGREEYIYSPIFFPDEHQIKKIFETWIDAQVIIPPEKLGSLTQLLHEHEAEMGEVDHFGKQRVIVNAKMPLRELMRNFFDELKSVTAGYGSLSYKIFGVREAPRNGIARLDISVAEEAVPAFTKIVSQARLEREARESVEKLQRLIPKALFPIKIQAKAKGRILAARSIAPLKKDVTGYLYGGDRTRKMKLWQKQKKGKEKLKKLGKGKARIPSEVFIKMMQS